MPLPGYKLSYDWTDAEGEKFSNSHHINLSGCSPLAASMGCHATRFLGDFLGGGHRGYCADKMLLHDCTMSVMIEGFENAMMWKGSRPYIWARRESYS